MKATIDAARADATTGEIMGVLKRIWVGDLLMNPERPRNLILPRTKILLAKPTQDAHDRGVRLLARKFRDAGFEVIFINFLTANEIVNIAVQEDVDVIGVSSSSGGHMPVFEDLFEGMRLAGIDDVLVIAGGVIPDADARRLREEGLGAAFGPGSSAEDAIQFIGGHVRQLGGI